MEYVEKKIKLITLDEEDTHKIDEVANILDELGNIMTMTADTHHTTSWAFRDESGYTIDTFCADTLKGLVKMLDKIARTTYLETNGEDK